AVSQMHATIARSRVSPYMWIVSGPRSTEPLWGDGMYASTLIPARAPARPALPLLVRLRRARDSCASRSQPVFPAVAKSRIRIFRRLPAQLKQGLERELHGAAAFRQADGGVQVAGGPVRRP